MIINVEVKFGEKRWNGRTQSFETLDEGTRYYTIEEPQMNKLDQLKKDHAELMTKAKSMGETIKQMEEAEPVWCASDIIIGVEALYREHKWIIIGGADDNRYNAILNGDELMYNDCVDIEAIVNHLNSINFKKA